MTLEQKAITIALCVLATLITRFLPFLFFDPNKETPKFIQYLGKTLPCAVFGMLVAYCLKDVDVLHGDHGLPEALGIALTVALHLWKRQALVSIGGGTIGYMLLVQLVFKG